MASRLLVPLGMISTSLGILALFAGVRGYPFLLLAAGGIVLARSCFSTGTDPAATRADPAPVPQFALPAVPECPPERLREARTLAARLARAASEDRARAASEDRGSEAGYGADAPGSPTAGRARVLADAAAPPSGRWSP
ncbi:hypothetical protein [Arthrobacter bussei]|uniref:Uncharacterized protein n=1 Tax=Arthrobacter bussei TaxID=2594179 RepID=A0A7X1TMU0_9MICC|nr:hypothetical protein [Arthrobacter bussei]MPY10002.1 hypothetical protein [Arthrobacter bussei]